MIDELVVKPTVTMKIVSVSVLPCAYLKLYDSLVLSTVLGRWSHPFFLLWKEYEKSCNSFPSSPKQKGVKTWGSYQLQAFSPFGRTDDSRGGGGGIFTSSVPTYGWSIWQPLWSWAAVRTLSARWTAPPPLCWKLSTWSGPHAAMRRSKFKSHTLTETKKKLTITHFSSTVGSCLSQVISMASFLLTLPWHRFWEGREKRKRYR